MLILKTPDEARKYIDSQKKKGINSIGFVPTMGALHQGHLALIAHSLSENQLVISSIFVNPTQFNNNEDFQKYPRQYEKDIALLEKAGCHALFLPEVEKMYPNPTLIRFNFGYLDEIMEGAFRPGHFSGVATVVSKLFNIIQPNKAYFGQKDLQQVAVIRRLIQDLSYHVELKVMPTLREVSGLAMSSRNARLSDKGKEVATVIYKTLNNIKEIYHSADFEKNYHAIVQNFSNDLIDLEYIEVVEAATLEKISINQPKKNIAVAVCIAAYVENVRLIDNIVFDA